MSVKQGGIEMIQLLKFDCWSNKAFKIYEVVFSNNDNLSQEVPREAAWDEFKRKIQWH